MTQGEEGAGSTVSQLVNDAGTTDLLDSIKDLILGARERVWVKVPWWDAAAPAGKALGEALVDARRRGVDVRVIMRNDATGLKIIPRLRKQHIDVRPSRYLHEKELIADHSYLNHSMNFTRMETSRNSQSGVLLTGTAEVNVAAARFLDMWEQLASIERQRGDETSIHAKAHVPDDYLPLLAYTTLNPFQADVAPAVLAADRHPGYLTRRWAHDHAEGRPCKGHHHRRQIAAEFLDHGVDGGVADRCGQHPGRPPKIVRAFWVHV